MRTSFTTSRPNSYIPSPEQLQELFLSILPRIQTHAQIRFQHLRCPGKREDAIAEVIAISWNWLLRIVEQNKDVQEFVMVLAEYAVRAVKSGRRVCGQEKSKDVFAKRAQRLNGFKLERLQTSPARDLGTVYSDLRGQKSVDALEDRLRDNTRSAVPDQAIFRIEYPRWLAQLGTRNRKIAQDMALDLTTKELAARYKVSPGRISQLRREFHKDWQQFTGDPIAC